MSDPTRCPGPAVGRRSADAGSGLISTAAGFVVFLAFCLLAVQLLLRLSGRLREKHGD